MSIVYRFLCAPLLLLLLALISPPADSRSDRLHLYPQLQPGQTLRYLIRYQAEKQSRTQSNMVAPMSPAPAPLDARGLLVLEILDVQSAGAKPILHARAHFEIPPLPENSSAPASDSTVSQSSPTSAATNSIEFTLFPDGHVEKVNGFDDLTPDQQQSWQEWLSLFAIAGLFPPNGVKQSEKWKSETVQNVPSPIANLLWEKESNYVNDQPCGSAHPAETCAVILTKSILKQKSSPKDATPEDFKLHQLRTLGTASGTNESFTYISLKTGLVVRATEEASQLMDVIVAKSDNSNSVHYTVDAKSHAEILLLPDSSPHP